MRFTFTIGRFTVYDFTIFEIQLPKSDDVVVIHQYPNDEEEDSGPGDIFGGTR